MRVVVSRERISHDKKVWVAQLLEHDFAVQGTEHQYPGSVVDQLFDHLDLHQLSVADAGAANPVESIKCAPPETFDLWERAAPLYWKRDPKRVRFHREGQENTLPPWDFSDVRISHFHVCGSFNAGDFGGCSPTEMQGIVFGRCEHEAFVLFRHPTEAIGHYRCLKHALQDHVVFEKAGWLTQKV